MPSKSKTPKKSVKVSDLSSEKKAKDVKGGKLDKSTYLK